MALCIFYEGRWLDKLTASVEMECRFKSSGNGSIQCDIDCKVISSNVILVELKVTRMGLNFTSSCTCFARFSYLLALPITLGDIRQVVGRSRGQKCTCVGRTDKKKEDLRSLVNISAI